MRFLLLLKSMPADTRRLTTSSIGPQISGALTESFSILVFGAICPKKERYKRVDRRRLVPPHRRSRSIGFVTRTKSSGSLRRDLHEQALSSSALIGGAVCPASTDPH